MRPASDNSPEQLRDPLEEQDREREERTDTPRRLPHPEEDQSSAWAREGERQGETEEEEGAAFSRGSHRREDDETPSASGRESWTGWQQRQQRHEQRQREWQERQRQYDFLTYILEARFAKGLGQRIAEYADAFADFFQLRLLQLFLLETILFECEAGIVAPSHYALKSLIALLAEFKMALPFVLRDCKA